MRYEASRAAQPKMTLIRLVCFGHGQSTCVEFRCGQGIHQMIEEEMCSWFLLENQLESNYSNRVKESLFRQLFWL